MAKKTKFRYRPIGKKNIYRHILVEYFDDLSDEQKARIHRKAATALSAKRRKGRPPKDRKTIVQEALAKKLGRTQTIDLVQEGISKAERVRLSREGARSALRKYEW